MSVLTINKKAITEDDGQRLIDQTCALRTPLGVPTEFIRPEEFEGYVHNFKKPFLKTLFSAFSDLSAQWNATKKGLSFLNHGGVGQEHPKSLDYSIGVSAEILNKARDPRKKYFADSLRIPEEQFEEHAHCYSPDTYRQPKSNLVKSFSGEVSSKNLMEKALQIESLDNPLPGTDAQLQFFVLWHEIAHGVGAGEPQADAMAAVVTRQAFESSYVLRAWSDYRALETMLYCAEPDDSKNIKGIAEQYGWPTVEVVDHVARLPQVTIDQMSEDDIRNIRFQKFDHMTESVLEIGRRLREKTGEEAFKARDFGALERAALDVCEDEDFGAKEQQILKRFALACRRFSVGEEAYTNEEELTPEELLESERAQPLTFMPGEHIPE